MDSWIISVVGASLIGSLHCVGMCGGIASFACTSGGATSTVLSTMSYHGGRLFTYASLGALAGFFGSSLDWASQSVGVGRVATIISGVGMLLWGLWSFLPARARTPTPGMSLYARWLARVHQTSPWLRAPLLGLLTGLLPCGWLYAFVVAAAGTADIWRGALLLTAFWSGTLPALLGVSAVIYRINDRLRTWVPAFSAAVMVALGLSSLWVHSRVPIDALRELQMVPSTSALPDEPHCH